MHNWNRFSHVTTCPDCLGAGVVHAYRRPTVNDPYPETPCECGLGEHLPECEVCGYNLEVAGYDCLACDTVASLDASALKHFDADAFAAAIKVALAKAREARSSARVGAA